MGTLKSLTILLTLGAWATATDGAPPDDAPPASPPASRQQPPAHPSKYLDAAQMLAKKGDARAADYARAADSYRDMLTAADQTKLDALLAQLAPAPKADSAVAPTSNPPADAPPNLGDGRPASTDATVHERARQLVAQSRQALANGHVDEARKLATEADALGAGFSGEEDHPKKLLAEIERPRTGGGLASRGAAPTDAKQQGRWLLQSAREQIVLGHYDDAEAKLAQARALNLRWTLFEDSPTRVAESLEKARPKLVAKGAKGDRRQADAKLREARGLIAAGQPQQAEALALEVASWNLRWSMLGGDNPTKVAQAARALRRRDASREVKPRNQPSEANYNNLVASSRELMRKGRLDEAQARAQQALSMNVTPALTADRAEAVLTDIGNARQAYAPAASVAATNAPTDPSVGTAATTTQVHEPASVAAERTANQLLASGEKDAAAAKFGEAQTLKTQEDAASVAAPIAAPAGAPVPDPVPDLAAAPPSLGDIPATATPAAPGGTPLDQAKTLMANGKYPEARRYADQAKAAGAGPEADQVLAQISGTEQAAAVQIYESVLASIRKGTEADMSHARGLLGELQGLELDESTKQKVEDLLMKLPKEGAGRATVGMSPIEDKETVEAMKLSAEVGTKIAESKHLMETDPDKAIALLTATIDQVKAAGCKESVIRTMTIRLQANIELAKKDKVAFDQKMKDKVFKGEIENKRLRILEADKAKKERIGVLMAKAETAMQNGEFDVAEKCYAQAAEINPNEIAARAGRYVAQARRYYRADVDNKARKEDGAVRAFQEVDRIASIPAALISGDIEMPETFRDLTAKRRDLAQRVAPRKSPRILETEKILNQPITINLDKTTLAEAIKYLGEMTGLNIITDGKALAEEAVTLNSPVSMHASQIKLKSVLKYMLKDLSLNYDIDEEGVLVITSSQMNQKRVYPMVHYVADLVVPVNQRPKGANGMPSIPGLTNDSVNLQNQALAMNGPMGAFEAPNGQASKPQRDARDVDFDPLIAMIKTAVAPGTWSNDHSPADGGMNSYGQGAGGAGAAGDDAAVGTITPFFLSISLIIRHTAEVHDDVVDLLRQLRRLQDLQVSIEVRFITVSDSFFEQIGVDFDFSIHSDAVGPKSSFAIPNPAVTLGGGGTAGGGTAATAAANPFLINPIRDHTQGNKAPLIVGAQGANGNTNPGNFTPNLQLPFTQNSASLITPFNALAGSNAATFGIAFLSDLEVYLFLSAIQGDTRSNLVQAPKVTSFNGAPASVVNITQRNYVAQLTPVAAAGAIAFAPQIGQIPDGVTLFVTPVVSADRRYVRMTLSPNFITFIQFDTFNVPAAVGGGGLGGQASAITAQIQLPVLSITNVNTTVTVPDGGTVLLGGVKRLREERREFGVPILSKTPLIDRLFRNIGIGRTTDSLMLMVTPRIIILEEEEEKLGIPSVQNITY